jgi:hypothetical protein
LVQLRGKWVEVDQTKLKEALDHWASWDTCRSAGVEISMPQLIAAKGLLSFSLRQLTQARNRSEDSPNLSQAGDETKSCGDAVPESILAHPKSGNFLYKVFRRSPKVELQCRPIPPGLMA